MKDFSLLENNEFETLDFFDNKTHHPPSHFKCNPLLR